MTRHADDDRAGGRNTMTRDADADLCTPIRPCPDCGSQSVATIDDDGDIVSICPSEDCFRVVVAVGAP